MHISDINNEVATIMDRTEQELRALVYRAGASVAHALGGEVSRIELTLKGGEKAVIERLVGAITINGSLVGDTHSLLQILEAVQHLPGLNGKLVAEVEHIEKELAPVVEGEAQAVIQEAQADVL
jgi:hypothetical protein